MRHNSLTARFFLNSVNFCHFRNNENNQVHVDSAKVKASIVLYDHDCPQCRRQMLRLKARDRAHRLVLININGPGFRASEWGVSYRDAMQALHVLTADKIWLVGMPAIRHVYAQVGLGWLMAPSGWPILSRFADLAYRYLAPNRYVLSRWLGGLESRVHCNDQACGSRHD